MPIIRGVAVTLNQTIFLCRFQIFGHHFSDKFLEGDFGGYPSFDLALLGSP